MIFQEFGGGFLSRFESSETDSDVLKSITIVDTPGILGILIDRFKDERQTDISIDKFIDRRMCLIILALLGNNHHPPQQIDTFIID